MLHLHRFAVYLLLAFASVHGRAEPPKPRTLARPVEVHRQPDLLSPVIQRLRPGERVWVVSEQNGISRVRYRRDDGWRSGFVQTDQLNQVATGPETEWQVGLTAAYSALSQGQRTFETQDQVHWTTSTYASQTIWPAVFIQWRHENFWRFSLGLRRVDFTGHAVADVDRSNTRAVEVKQNMVSGRLERAWRLLNPAYVTVGAEVARALSLSEWLGGVRVPTTSADIKVYAGGSLGVGANFPVMARVDGFAEARAGVYPTLSPMALVFEAAVGAGYWF